MRRINLLSLTPLPRHEVPRSRELHPLDIVPVTKSGEALLRAPGVLLHVIVQLVQLGAADLGLRYFKYYLTCLEEEIMRLKSTATSL